MRLSFAPSAGLFPAVAVGRGYARGESTSAALPRLARRSAGVDAMRLLASCAVVFYHTLQTPTLHRLGGIAHFATPLFSVLAGLFIVTTLRASVLSYVAGWTDQPPAAVLGSYLRKRVLRLYIPFLAWTAIYLILAQTPLRPAPLGENALSIKWLAAPVEGHLWFLPFLTAMTLVFAPLAAWALAGSRRREVAVAAGLGVAAAALPFIPLPLPESTPWYLLSVHSRAPSFLAGLCIGLAMCDGLRIPRLSFGRCVFIVGALLAGVLACWWRQLPIAAVNLAGLAAFTAGICPVWDRLGGRWLEKFGAISFGVYLVHVVAVNLVHASMLRAGLAPSIPIDLASATLVLALAIGLAVALKRSALTRWLVP